MSTAPIQFRDILLQAQNAASHQGTFLTGERLKDAVARAFVAHMSGLILEECGPEADAAFCRALGFEHLIGV